ncbi:hypothetical protein [Zongyangia hominis]|uniref:Uncharacterized protein n=1 Tax=Zongyangia hominis TaxID=2763677 RepID=A0A926IB74_9FIRM|nr:hypothetical protein [Zongyangia hominis]MBC8569882.1 hypothetical protein [Zongyangia hominis]
MDEKNPPRPYDMLDDEELYDEMMEVASATECTGLMPAAPITKPETESYSKIYDIPLAKDDVVDEMMERKKKNRE